MLPIFAACGGGSHTTTAPASRPVPVSVITARYESVPAVVEAPGTVQPRSRIALSSQINGFVREMRVRAGDTVSQGQVLATLDSRDAENQKALSVAAVDEARAALAEAGAARQAAIEMRTAARSSSELASQTLSRYQKLFEARSVSPQEIDEVRARRDGATAELAARESMVAAADDRIRQIEARILQAKAQAGRSDVMMGWTQIKAPAPGKVVERMADSGTAIFPGTPLLVIESTARPQVLADIPTERAAGLRPGMEVRLRSAAASEVSKGKIAEIIPRSNAASHTVQFKVDLPPDSSLPTGQFVKVEIPIGTRDSLLVPRRAIRETGQLTGLFVADGASKARFRLIKAAPYDDAFVEVLSGVEPGEIVIASLTDQIMDGISLEIRK